MPSQATDYSTDDPAETQNFPCMQCGTSLEYLPGSKLLRCKHCGYENSIIAVDTPIAEQDFRQTLYNLSQAIPVQEAITIHCQSCGATYSFDNALHAGDCPFCAAPVVANTALHRSLHPQALLPFQITRDQARQAFRTWLGNLWLAPSKLRDAARNDARLSGIYVPYWTYDANTNTSYSGERGDNYQVQETYQALENGQSVTRTRTVTKIRWCSVSGLVTRFFDDVLVLASNSLPRDITEKLEPWDLANLTPYQEDYLSGFRSEMYQIELDQGFEHAKQIMEITISRDIKRHIGGDHQRIKSKDTRYDAIRFKHILLPIWMSSFQFREKIYRFVVNGRTGEVQGERPYSAWKIAFTALLTALLIGGAVALWQHYR